jgi:hypothetical protein
VSKVEIYQITHRNERYRIPARIERQPDPTAKFSFKTADVKRNPRGKKIKYINKKGMS